jgi:N-carbamoylputrescine amidase
MRALGVAGAELVVIPQAGVVDEWPEGFFEAEVCTAAFQNGYFAALCNRVGREERLTFAGESFVCGPEGAVRARAARGEDAVLTADLDLREVDRSHARRVLMNDRRPELYAAWLAGTGANAPR